MIHTLSIQEITDWEWMASIGFQRCVPEDIVKLVAGTISHVLLSDSLDVITNIGVFLLHA